MREPGEYAFKRYVPDRPVLDCQALGSEKEQARPGTLVTPQSGKFLADLRAIRGLRDLCENGSPSPVYANYVNV